MQTKRQTGTFKKSMAVAGLMLAIALPAFAGESGVAGDEQLRRAAEESIQASPYLGVFDHVTVDVRDGYVRLSGSVEQRGRRDKAAAAIARVPGVLGIQNEVEVQSSSPEDVMLRRRLFERLYYGGAIEGNGRPEWPVRILVSDGRVTLAGDLAVSAERARLETIARNAGARLVETRMQAQVVPVTLSAAQK